MILWLIVRATNWFQVDMHSLKLFHLYESNCDLCRFDFFCRFVNNLKLPHWNYVFYVFSVWRSFKSFLSICGFGTLRNTVSRKVSKLAIFHNSWCSLCWPGYELHDALKQSFDLNMLWQFICCISLWNACLGCVLYILSNVVQIVCSNFEFTEGSGCQFLVILKWLWWLYFFSKVLGFVLSLISELVKCHNCILISGGLLMTS